MQWQCPEHQYNGMATLLHTGQEGLIKHLFARQATTASDPLVLGVFLIVYFILASAIFGTAVPAGNFLTAMTIGGVFGRLIGVLLSSDLSSSIDPGMYSLLGAAAVLGGVTRMTLTLAVILVEVTKDVNALLPLMIVLAVAKLTGDLLSPSFDDAMMHLEELPYLEEEPPHEFDVLLARDVMSRQVVVLRENEPVKEIIALIKRTRHNGFPVVDVGPKKNGSFFTGLILRNQLLVLLSQRVWELQEKGQALPEYTLNRFVDSAFDSRENARMVYGLKLDEEDRAKRLDITPFMDHSPYTVNELMPLRRVYRLFNEIGVRHLTVVDCREQVVGIITRKDILPDSIEERLLSSDNVEMVSKLLDGKQAEARRRFSVTNAVRRASQSISGKAAPTETPEPEVKKEIGSGGSASTGGGLQERSHSRRRAAENEAASPAEVRVRGGVLTTGTKTTKGMKMLGVR